MRVTLRSLFILSVLVAVPAAAAPKPLPSPDAVFAQLSSASPQTELGSLQQALALFQAQAKAPSAAVIVGALQNLSKAARLDSVDLARPLHVLWLDPKRFAQPVVLVFDVKNVAAFKQALIESPAVASRQRKNHVAIGDEAALAQVGDYALGLTAAGPGVRALLRLDRLWASFGEQAKAMLPMVMAAAQAQAKTASPAMMKGVVDALISGAEQGASLLVDVRFAASRFDIFFTLETKPGMSMSTYFAAQRPSDFALLGKLAPQDPMTLVLVGDLDVRGARFLWTSALLGAEPTEQEKKDVDAIAESTTGAVAVAGEFSGPGNMSFQSLAGTRDYRKVLEAYPRIQNMVARGRAQSQQIAVKLGARKTTVEDGLDIGSLELSYDMSKMPGFAGKPPIQSVSTWTGWDGYLASAFGSTAPALLRKLVATARRGEPGLVPTPVMVASVAQARAAKDTLWMAIDPGSVGAAATGTPTAALPKNFLATMSIGFGAQSARLHLALVSK